VSYTYRLCVLITELGVGGAQRVLADVVTSLPKDRYQVLVACLFNPGTTAAQLRAVGVDVIDLCMSSKLDFLVFLRLCRLLRQFQPHLLHTHMFHANLLGRLAGRITGVPFIVSTEHTMGQENWSRRLLNRITSHLCDRVIAVSQSVGTFASRVIGIEADRIVVIPNGIEVEKFQSSLTPAQARHRIGLSDETDVVGTVGTLRRVKGTEILLQAFSQLFPRWPQAKLLIVGDGPEREHLQQMTQRAGLDHSTIFTGERRDVADLLAAMSVFVLPSHWEGFGLAVVEAMAAGLPVVATRVGSLPEVISERETGLLVSPADPTAMASAIEYLLNNPQLRSKMGRAGRQRAKTRYSREQMVAKTEELYTSLLSAHSAESF
jgi:sugar transferase (PEP-CTERM/EpsH1 system associated)